MQIDPEWATLGLLVGQLSRACMDAWTAHCRFTTAGTTVTTHFSLMPRQKQMLLLKLDHHQKQRQMQRLLLLLILH